MKMFQNLLAQKMKKKMSPSTTKINNAEVTNFMNEVVKVKSHSVIFEFSFRLKRSQSERNLIEGTKLTMKCCSNISTANHASQGKKNYQLIKTLDFSTSFMTKRSPQKQKQNMKSFLDLVQMNNVSFNLVK